MAEKFSVKHEGKEIWTGMAMTEREAFDCAILANPKLKDKDVALFETKIVLFTDPRLVRITSEDGQSGVTTEANTPKPRKPRADKGQPRKSSIQQPQKETKGRQYLVAENVTICNSRAELEAYLTGLSEIVNVRIFNYTHELKAKSQFKLETI